MLNPSTWAKILFSTNNPSNLPSMSHFPQGHFPSKKYFAPKHSKESYEQQFFLTSSNLLIFNLHNFIEFGISVLFSGSTEAVTETILLLKVEANVRNFVFLFMQLQFLLSNSSSAVLLYLSASICQLWYFLKCIYPLMVSNHWQSNTPLRYGSSSA